MATVKKDGEVFDIYILVLRTESGEVFVESYTDETLKEELLKENVYDGVTFLSKYPDGELTLSEAIIIHTPTNEILVPKYKIDVEF